MQTRLLYTALRSNYSDAFPEMQSYILTIKIQLDKSLP